MPQTTPMPEEFNYCETHYRELLMALCERQLGDHIAEDQEQLVERLTEGKMDVGLEATNAIMTSAFQVFGPDAMRSNEGCPICTFRNIINHVADNLAAKYLRSN